MNKFTVTVLVLFFSLPGYAQTTDIANFFKSDLQKAEILYERKAYANAIELYQRVLDKNPNEARAKLRIAESYTALNDPANAVRWYGEVIDQHDLEDHHFYSYAQSLSAVERYEEAKYWYQVYSQKATEDTRALKKIGFIDQIDFYKRDSALFYIEHLPFNSEKSDFAAVPFEEGLVFLSARDNDLFIKYKDAEGDGELTQARLDLYFTAFNDTSYSQPTKFNQSINTRFHEGPLAFFHNSRKVIFTRNNYYHNKAGRSKDGQIKLKLYTTSRDENNNWTDFQPFPYNDDEYSTGHPALSMDDQVLYFASDMPGGFGGSDLYACQWQGGKWTAPVNLGPEINTPGEEMFPFAAHDGNLYFASNGHGGFGGLDVYRSYPSGRSFGRVENLGFPLNTSSDDFAFTLSQDGRSGYISSNRPGGAGRDDVYQFHRRFLNVVGQVLTTKTDAPVPYARIMIYDSTQRKHIIKEADSAGYFHADLLLDTRFGMKAEREGYSLHEYTYVSSGGNRFETDTVSIYMWKHRLFAEGRVFSNETHELLKGAEVTIHNLTDDSIRVSKIREAGTYFFVLETNRQYRIKAEMPDHIASEFVLNTEGLEADTLRNDFVLEEMYRDKDVVFFDFDAAELSSETVSKLNEMIRVMRKYKHTHMVISAHADAQGTFEYNKALSDRRALAVVAYLKSKGITDKRIMWRGFGEELLLNKCSDGVECHQEDHSLNRRAEIKIEDEKPEDPFAGKMEVESSE